MLNRSLPCSLSSSKCSCLHFLYPNHLCGTGSFFPWFQYTEPRLYCRTSPLACLPFLLPFLFTILHAVSLQLRMFTQEYFILLILCPSAHKILQNLHICSVSVEYHYCDYMKSLPHPLSALTVQVRLVSRSLRS